MSTVGDRLRQAIDQKVGSIRYFEKKLKRHAPNLRGTSRQTIYRYLDAESDPPPGFIRAAAEVMSIRDEWLASGQGAMDEEAERLRARQEVEMRRLQPAQGVGASEEERRWFDRFQAIDVGLNRLPGLRGMMGFSGGEALFRGVLVDLLQARGRSLSDWTAEDVEEAAYLLGSLVFTPAEALWGRDPNMGLPGGRDEEYFLAMVAAIRAALVRTPASVGPGWGPEWVLERLREFQTAWQQIDVQAQEEEPNVEA